VLAKKKRKQLERQGGNYSLRKLAQGVVKTDKKGGVRWNESIPEHRARNRDTGERLKKEGEHSKRRTGGKKKTVKNLPGVYGERE